MHVHARVWVAPVTAGADTLPAGDCARACQKARARKLPHPETERPPTEERQVCEAKVASWSSRIGSSAGGAPKPRHDQAHGRARGAGVEGSRGSERAEGSSRVGGIAPMLSICIYIYLRDCRLYVSIAPHTRPPPHLSIAPACGRRLHKSIAPHTVRRSIYLRGAARRWRITKPRKSG